MEQANFLLPWLRRASALEGLTLLTLVFVAVPVKYLAGNSGPVSILGPIHGIAFLSFMGLLFRSHWTLGWTNDRMLRLVAGAFVPFGALLNARLLREIEAQQS